MSIVERLTHDELREAAEIYVENTFKKAVADGQTTINIGVTIAKSSYSDNYQIKHTIGLGDYPSTETFTGTDLQDVFMRALRRQEEVEAAKPIERTLALAAPVETNTFNQDADTWFDIM